MTRLSYLVALSGVAVGGCLTPVPPVDGGTDAPTALDAPIGDVSDAPSAADSSSASDAPGTDTAPGVDGAVRGDAGGAPDAPTFADAGTSPDAGPAGTCLPTFSSVTLVPIEAPTIRIEGPAVSADGRSLYFGSFEPFNLFRVDRGTTADEFVGPLVALTELNTGGFEGHPSFALGDTMIVFDRTVPWMATRAAPSGAFSSLVQLQGFGGNALGASVTGDGLCIVFFSDRAGTYDLYEACRSSPTTDLFDPPVALDVLNSAVTWEAHPGVTADGLTVYFETNRDGGLDIYRSTRPTRGGPWAPPERVPMASSAGEDRTPQPSPDGCELYFVSTRGTAPQSVYVAR